MKDWQHKIENKLYHLGHKIYTYKYLVLVLCIAFVIALGLNLKKLTMDTSIEGFLHTNDKDLIAYESFKEQFGKDDKVVVTIEAKDTIFTHSILASIKKLHDELSKNVPNIDKIDSLSNIRDTVGKDGELIVADFLDKLPITDTNLAEYKQRASEKYIYENMVISKDTKLTNIIITLNAYKKQDIATNDLLANFATTNEQTKREKLSDSDILVSIQKIQEIAKAYNSDEIKIHIVGSPVVDAYLKKMMQDDIKKFVKIILLVIAIFLFVLFRRVFAVVLPLITIVLSVVATISFMAMFDVPIKMPTQIVPSFLLAVGIGACVHFLAIFVKEYNHTKDKREAIAYTFRHSALAIIMTSLTTMAGLISFYFSKIAPISDLGIFATLGVFVALVFTLTMLPALLAIIPIKPKDMTHNKLEKVVDKILLSISHLAITKAKEIVIASALIVVVSLIVASKLEFSHNTLKWLPQEYEVRKSTEQIDTQMRGTVTIEMIVDTKKTNGLYEIPILKGLESFQSYAMSINTNSYFVGKAWSIVEVLKETNQALHDNDKTYYTIPDNANLIAQELFLFENSGSDDLEDVVDSDFSKARVTIKVPWIDATKYTALLDDLETKANEIFKDKATITITGIAPIFNKTINQSILSSGYSYILAFAIICAMMILLLSDIKLGLVSMIPNISPIIFGLSVMYVFDMPLDMFTMLIGSIAIGIAVDDTIHFMHNFKRSYYHTGSVEESITTTLTNTGRAMFVTSIVLSAGFLVYTLANMGNLVNFGILSAVVIMMALVADFLLSPALVVLFAKQLFKDKK